MDANKHELFFRQDLRNEKDFLNEKNTQTIKQGFFFLGSFNIGNRSQFLTD